MAAPTDEKPKINWQLALAVGAPVAIGLVGVWYWRRSRAKMYSDIKDQENSIADSIVEETVEPTALDAKNKGNKYFKGGKYDKAIECYTKAISLCPAEKSEELATFYQNRAAAHEKLSDYNSVIDDCTQALGRNIKYIKALQRRAKAAEQVGKLEMALEDITATCIMQGFQVPESLQTADRVLKALGAQHAKEAFVAKKPTVPSKQFVRTYLGSFYNDPLQHTKIEDQKETDNISPYEVAVREVLAEEFSNVEEQCSLELGRQDSERRNEALLLRATFRLLCGDGEKALDDFKQLLEQSDLGDRVRSNALIKRGSLRMQSGEKEFAMADFKMAVEADPENSDIYHHRGQLYLLLENVADAMKDFETCVKLAPDFPVAVAQKVYTEYKMAIFTQSQSALNAAMKEFENTINKFPDCSEGFALHGQALMDQQLYAEADAKFQKAITVEPDNANIYVHRGLVQLHWKQNVDETIAFMEKAIEIDEKCEFAYETLGTIEVQRGNLPRAQDLFSRALQLVRTEAEMAHLYSLIDATKAQQQVAKNFGISPPSFQL